MSKTLLQSPLDYSQFLVDLKSRVVAARTTAVQSVNRELILLYWDIGQGLAEKQKAADWGDAVVARLGRDLRAAFPDMSGFSLSNLWRMKQFYLSYADVEVLAQPVREILPSKANNKKLAQPVRDLVAAVPWGHHINALTKIADPATRLYYLRATAQFGWSRKVLQIQIKACAYERAVLEKKAHNFPLTLPEHLAEQADEMMKSRYNLEFLGIGQAVKERELEDRLVGRLQQFILELGFGFCFIGRQYRLALGRKEYFVDLLFYHRFLKALVAFDLKIGAFEPEHAGKMDFYLNLLNETERAPDDQPSIGIILCAEKDAIEVEFSLKTKTNPIGVAEYQFQQRLPAEFKGRLPTARQLADAVRDALPPKE